MYGRSEGTRDARGLVTIRAFGGVKGLTLFKTTQSSFTDFHKDNHTSLPEVTDRSVSKIVDKRPPCIFAVWVPAGSGWMNL